MTFLAVLTFGLLLGVRHATDADHIVAVSTIVSRERSLRSALRVGAFWGIGHTTTILIVGGAIVLLGLAVPPRVSLALELAVALMLIVLGAMNVASSAGLALPAANGAARGASAARASETRRGVGLRPFVVGTIHGLAGSAAMALLVLTTIREAGRALLYLGVFGIGTIAGMMLLTAAVSVPVAAASRRMPDFDQKLARVTGWLSIGFGLFLMYEIGFVDGLFLASVDP